MTIKELEKNIVFIKELIGILKQEPTSVEDLVFKKYIELESLGKVKKFLQEKGIKTERGTIFQSNDLSDIIVAKPDDVDKLLIKLAYKQYSTNVKLMNRLYN